MGPLITVVLVVVLIVVAVLLVLNLYGRMFRKVGPNQALIVYGAGGRAFSRVVARWSFRWCRNRSSSRWS